MRKSRLQTGHPRTHSVGAGMFQCLVMFHERAANTTTHDMKKMESTNGKLKTIVRVLVLTMSTAFSAAPACCPEGRGSIRTPVWCSMSALAPTILDSMSNINLFGGQESLKLITQMQPLDKPRGFGAASGPQAKTIAHWVMFFGLKVYWGLDIHHPW